MRLAITGAGGYIGKHVAQKAYTLGHSVLKISRTESSKDIVHKLDVLEASQEDIVHRFSEIDACIHLAWQSGFNHQSSYHLESVLKHYYFIEKLILSGVKNITVAGTMHEIGYFIGEVNEYTTCNPINPYGIAKNFLRQSLLHLCRQNQVSLKWLRLFYITGDDENNNSIFNKLLSAERNKEKTFPLNSGEMLFDFIHVEDLAEQIIQTALQTTYTGVINCCSGTPVSLKTKVEQFILEKGLSIKPEYNKFPRREYDSYAIWGDASIIKTIMSSIPNRDIGK